MSFIKEHSEGYPVKTMCRLLGVSVEGYRQHCQRQREPGARERTNAQLRARIVSIHKASRQTYGSPRITLQLKREGSGCGHNRVARLMKSVGIEGCQQRRYRVQTTQSDHDCPVAPNLAAGMPVSGSNQLWHADITYIATEEGWSYLAAILDNHTRKIVGWSMQATLKSDLVIEALHRAIKQQKPSRGLVHHSDRGVQYACKQYRKCLQSAGMVASMSRRGNCYDNATMESFFGTLKREQIQRTVYASRHQARLEVFSYIEGFYNPCRIHTSLGGRSPMEMEQLGSGLAVSPPTN